MDPNDIWRTAKLIVDQHGIFAPQECRRRADEFAAAGDTDAQAVWEAIRLAAAELLENGPPQDIPGLPS
ncbi:hypothetical protein [Dongia sedimenti]|uniref:DUF982 domain-containing protein n=1 Tax=Dongia sedimenti TaxID=3064282 RepID=A0ABU0YTH6_9PROT|nr:hypothetical protein [Rhodospirillaceae bacterium R-7]